MSVTAHDIVYAVNKLGDAVRDFERTHPDIRFREEQRVKECFTSLARLMRDSIADEVQP